MPRELLILRHGKSEKTAGGDDFGRPIKDGGKRSAQRMGIWLWRQDLVPDHVVSSPAVRAKETARKACKAMGLGNDDVVTAPAIYGASRQDLLQVLAARPATASRVMLVGHNPGMTEVYNYLTGESLENIPTFGVAHLVIDVDEVGF